MSRAIITGVLAALIPLVSTAQTNDPLHVTAVRFWSLTGVTRVAIEADDEFDFRSDTLHDPERLFFDVLDALPRVGGRGIHTITVGDKLIKRIRVAQTQRGMTRIVLDLEVAVEFTASQLSNPARLMIEVRPKPIGAPPPSLSAPLPSASALSALRPPAPALIEEAPPVLSGPARVDSLATIPATAIRRVPPPPAAPARVDSVATVPAPVIRRVPPPPPASPARRTASGDSTLVRVLGLKIGRVVLDPGHGGHDQGSRGRAGLLEKDLTLDVAKRLGALIEERLGAEVVYTRSDDSFVALESRTEMANEKKADLFLSIHANSSSYPDVSGIETFYLNLTTSQDAMDVATRENAGSNRSIYELTGLIEKITKHDKVQESREFASKMQASLYTFAARSNTSAKNRGIKTAPFVVLIGATMPSILAEIGFLSNPREEALLKRPEHRQRLAEALYRGVQRYAETLSHFQVARAKD